MGLDAQVAKHSVGAPASKQLDCIRVNAGAKESGGASRAQGACRQLTGRDASQVFHRGGGMAEGRGDELGRDIVPLAISRIEVFVKRDVGSSLGPLEAKTDPTKSQTRAKERVASGGMANPFALHAVLLVSKLKRSMSDLGDRCVIQRGGWGGVVLAIHVEVDVLEEEGSGLGVRRGCSVLPRAEEPEEGDNDEVNDNLVGGTQGGVVGVKGGDESLDDSGVGRVDSPGRVIGVAEALDKRVV